jgi:hypothetical protein
LITRDIDCYCCFRQYLCESNTCSAIHIITV